jgi:hypothetical protein
MPSIRVFKIGKMFHRNFTTIPIGQAAIATLQQTSTSRALQNQNSAFTYQNYCILIAFHITDSRIFPSMRRFGRKERSASRRRAHDLHTVDFERRLSRPASITRLERGSQVSLVLRKSERLSRPTSKSSTVKRSTSDRSSPFLRLPVEIRLVIFRYLLPAESKKIKVYTDCDASYTDRKWSVQRAGKRPTVDPFTLAILRTNRLIYYEALSVLYSENAFHFIGSNFLPILDFIRRLSPDSKGLVRQLKVTSKYYFLSFHEKDFVFY